MDEIINALGMIVGDKENFKKSSSTMQVGGDRVTTPPTCPETIINCCFDYYKFVFPYCNTLQINHEEQYRKLYDEYKKNLSELSDDEIFELIEMDYPRIKPGFNYEKSNEKVEEDPITGVWSLEKIKTALEHWFCIEKFIPDCSKERIDSTRGFKYLQSYTPGISFAYEGAEQKVIYNKKEYLFKTCCIELKGEGCRKVEKNGVDLLKLLNQIYSIPGCHATRVDFATDLINNQVITFDWLFEKIFKQCSYQSSFLKIRPIIDYEKKTTPSGLLYHENLGTTITFGSKSSTSRMNIYDKKAERFNNAGLDVLVDSWIRFEVQVFNEKADRVIKTLMADIVMKKFDEFCFSLLFKHLDIKLNKNLYNDENYRPSKTRTWPTDPIWLEFMQNAGKVEIISQQKLEADFTRTRNWYERSVIPTQTFLDIFYAEDPSSKIPTLNKQIDYLEELDDKQLSILNQYRKEKLKCACNLTYKDIEEKRQKFFVERDELLILCELVE